MMENQRLANEIHILLVNLQKETKEASIAVKEQVNELIEHLQEMKSSADQLRQTNDELLLRLAAMFNLFRRMANTICFAAEKGNLNPNAINNEQLLLQILESNNLMTDILKTLLPKDTEAANVNGDGGESSGEDEKEADDQAEEKFGDEKDDPME